MMAYANPNVAGRPGYSSSGGGATAALYANIRSYWQLGEASGTRVDSVGSNNLTATNAPGTVVSFITNLPGSALSLVSGSNQYLSCPWTQNGNVNMSFAIWVKPHTTGVQRGIASVEDVVNGGTPQWLIQETAANLFTIYWSGGYRFSSAAFTVDTVHLIVVTFDGVTATMKFYVDGVSLGSFGPNGNMGGAKNTLFIGAGYPTYFDGGMQQAISWDRELTPENVSALWNGGNGVLLY